MEVASTLLHRASVPGHSWYRVKPTGRTAPYDTGRSSLRLTLRRLAYV